MSGESNGKGAKAPSPEEMAAIQHALNNVATEAYLTLTHVFPLMKDEQRQQIAQGVAGDVLKVRPILEKLFAGELGTIGVNFERKTLVQLVGLEGTGAPSQNPNIGIRGLAKLSEITVPHDVLSIVAVLGVLTSPSCRAVVAALGYTPRFLADPRKPDELQRDFEKTQKRD